VSRALAGGLTAEPAWAAERRRRRPHERGEAQRAGRSAWWPRMSGYWPYLGHPVRASGVSVQAPGLSASAVSEPSEVAQRGGAAGSHTARTAGVGVAPRCPRPACRLPASEPGAGS